MPGVSPREGAGAIDNPSLWGTGAWGQLVAVAVLVVFLHVPLGNYIAAVYTSRTDLRVERVIYRLVGVRPDGQQRWTGYLTAVLAFSAVSVLLLYGLLLLQVYLPEPWGHKGMTPALAFNTAISFTANTSWQNYAGEATLGHVGLVAGLGVQAFASLAVGMCVAVVLIRGLARYQNQEIGNFCTCRRSWSAPSPTRVSDQRAVKVGPQGVKRPLRPWSAVVCCGTVREWPLAAGRGRV